MELFFEFLYLLIVWPVMVLALAGFALWILVRVFGEGVVAVCVVVLVLAYHVNSTWDEVYGEPAYRFTVVHTDNAPRLVNATSPTDAACVFAIRSDDLGPVTGEYWVWSNRDHNNWEEATGRDLQAECARLAEKKLALE